MTSLLFDKTGGGTLSQRILGHVDRYRITTPHVVERLFFSAEVGPDHHASIQQATEALGELVSAGKLLRLVEPQSSKKNSATSDSAATKISKPQGSFAESVYVHPEHKLTAGVDLARLWFCCLDTERRYFALHEEIEPLFAEEGIDPPYHNFFHAISQEEGGDVLFRLYLCRAEKKNARDQLKSILTKYAKQFHQWIDQGSYGVAVIVQTKQKKNEIEQLLQKSYGGKLPLDNQARFIVTVVPTEQSYPEAIKQYEKKVWK
ncbi:hypothetical protein [Bythopirellula goksoeyrii]|uniref:Uncharacterized protein n=1 Tax=Bythopirellula goksoeyrii TaxID=1400387 RepID=A0A5B9QFY4_9BACT|nr:hypothetical protein [Bythopirellula goksoeyrii]QEG35836.1 hypothetical protein Pr1d_31420 [Bythopirellula goksoeyrii]